MMKQHSAAAERNAPHIDEVLTKHVPNTARIWEIGSGTGQHTVYFAERHAGWSWLPSNHGDLESIVAYRAEANLPNVAAPLVFDLFQAFPAHEHVDVVYSANVLHIAPAAATTHFFRHAQASGARQIVLYGPFQFADRPLEPSNAEFNLFLAQTYPGGGIRMFEDVVEAARQHGFALQAEVPMPANNHCLVFARTA